MTKLFIDINIYIEIRYNIYTLKKKIIIFIGRVVSKNKKYDNQKYYTYRLVQSYRVGGKVKQRVLIKTSGQFLCYFLSNLTTYKQINTLIASKEIFYRRM